MARALILPLRPCVDGGVPARRDARLQPREVLAQARRGREAKARASRFLGDLHSMPDLTAGPADAPFQDKLGDVLKGPCCEIVSREARFASPQVAGAWG